MRRSLGTGITFGWKQNFWSCTSLLRWLTLPQNDKDISTSLFHLQLVPSYHLFFLQNFSFFWKHDFPGSTRQLHFSIIDILATNFFLPGGSTTRISSGICFPCFHSWKIVLKFYQGFNNFSWPVTISRQILCHGFWIEVNEFKGKACRIKKNPVYLEFSKSDVELILWGIDLERDKYLKGCLPG